MFFDVMKKNAYLQGLTVIMIIVLFANIAGTLHAQVPTLDPAQTVNVPSGSMEFALPLGTVMGYSGRDFPLMLGYQAGIQFHQEASPVGLGFSIGVGEITRNVVYIPDDMGGDHFTFNEDTDCDLTGWRKWINPVIRAVNFTVAMIMSGLVGNPAPLAWWAFDEGMSTGIAYLSAKEPPTGSYNSGGTHTTTYSYIPGQIKGFFKGGKSTDLPDVYVLNSPYVSGTMVWQESLAGGKEKFVLKKNGLSSDICYDVANETFTVTSSDGTIMIFDKTTQFPYHDTLKGRTYDDDSHVQCAFTTWHQNRESIPAAWHLTKVLYPDYVDGSAPADLDPSNSLSTNHGSWIYFDYDEITGYDLFPENYCKPYQVSAHSSALSGIGHKTEFYYWPGPDEYINWDGEESFMRFLTIRRIVTPNQSADFNYTMDRQDNKWFHYNVQSTENGVPYGELVEVSQPVLRNIEIKNSADLVIRKVSFATSYRLREDEGNDGSLTLEKITIMDDAENALPPINFEYVTNNPRRDLSNLVPSGPGNEAYIVEDKDLWGYYNATQNNHTSNNFNLNGVISHAQLADAWSLKKISFPEGYSISWVYEPNRYKLANNVPVNANGVSKYGDGIRVRQVVVEDPLSSTKKWTYIYTAENGIFEENETNSSGYASVEPIPYTLFSSEVDAEDEDIRPKKARGGLYAPAVVGYGKVQVVENFNEFQPTEAPTGYTVYNFTSTDEYPNLGAYGQQDMSPLRGMLKKVTVYNKNGSVISENENKYKVEIARNKYDAVPEWKEDCWGTWFFVSPVEEVVNNGGVQTRKTFVYSSSSTNTADAVNVNKMDRFITFEHRGLPIERSKDRFIWSQYQFYQTNLLGRKSGTGCKDIVILGQALAYNPMGTDANSIGIMVLQDVDGLNELYNHPEAQSNYKEYVLPFTTVVNEILNVKTGDLDGGGDLDIYIEYAGEDIKLSNVRIGASGELLYETGTFATPTEFSEPAAYIPFCLDDDNGLLVIPNNTVTLDRDGRPNRTVTTNSEGKLIISQITPAFTQTAYGDMLTKNILAPICQSTTLAKGPGTSDVEYVVSAQATTWSKTIGTPAWVPNKSYSWKSDFRADGTPEKTFADFDHTTGVTNANWQLNGSTDLYNSNGGALQASNAKGVPSSIFFSNDNILPIMSISNAPYGTSLFTNWTENQPTEVNIATKTMSTASADLHFAGRTLKLTTNTSNPTGDQYAVAAISPVNSNLPSLGGKSFTVQFWAKGDRACQTFLHLQAMPGFVWSDYQNIDVTTAWKKYEIQMKFPTGVTDKQFQLVLRPPHTFVTPTYIEGTILYDDIRVTPAGALSTVNYYDPVWRQVNLSLDEQNNPGKKVTFDSFGRPIKWDKVDPSKSVGDAGYATTVQQKAYHLRNDLPTGKLIQVLYPDGGEDLRKSRYINIQWVNDGTRSVKLYYKQKTAPNWTEIFGNPLSNQTGWCSYNWDVTTFGPTQNEYLIKAEIPSVESDESDGAFILSGPNTAPTVPSGISAAQANPDNIIVFNWSASTDAHGDPVTYNVFVVGKGYVGQNVTGTTLSKAFKFADQKQDPINDLHEWYVEASDGELVSTSATGTFRFIYVSF